MKTSFFILSVLCIVTSELTLAQTFTESKLPIVIINTGGQEIPDDPKIDATMKIIYRGPGLDNFVSDQNNPAFLNYNGLIGIEIRGTTSQFIEKKPYGLETRKLNSSTNLPENQNVSLLGMPSENDWILNNMAYDASYIRNYLIYNLFGSMGHYSSRTVFCEVIVNDDYKGLYMLQEKIKEDGNRVNIEEITTTDNALPNLSGGYITKADKTTGGDPVAFTMDSYRPDQPVQIIHDTPDPVEVTSEQNTYVEGIFRSLETAAGNNDASITNGFPSMIDIPTFIDFILLNELASNVDAYQYSTYFHKDRNGKLRAGPVWDFNSSLGSDQGATGGRSTTYDWQFINGDNEGPKFFRQLFENPIFRCYAAKRWNMLTQPGMQLNLATMEGIIDALPAMLTESVERDKIRWAYTTFLNEQVDMLKTFLGARISWINDNIGPFADCSSPVIPSLVINEIMYNPPGSSENQEFIEIKNTGTTTADLTGIYFSTLGISYQFPAGRSLSAGGFLVLASNTSGYQTQYGSLPFDQFTRKLPNSSHKLVLSDAFGNIIDEVQYFDSSPWPTDADGGGKSLELRATNLDNNLAASWFTRSQTYGSPGLENFSALPVTLVRFDATLELNTVSLKWTVADEIEIEKYVVEFSTNGKTFYQVGEVRANGNTEYHFTHPNPSSGNNYYRLKSIESDQRFAYSRIVLVSGASSGQMILYPNPTDGLLSIKINPDLVDQNTVVKITSMDGKTIFRNTLVKLRPAISLDLKNVAPGKYIIRFENETGSFSKPIEVIR